MANAWCINAIWFDWSLIRTLENLDSSNIWVWVQFTAPNLLDDKRFDYIKYTDKNWNTCCLSWENEILIYATNWTIKNLTLTNDDANEVVNVKRSDVFWSNRKKTVVRYKTWWYPTSITDWTLAVEELVQNQYASSWFNVSWLSDWTTYYFSAFAVAQDDTIIVVQTNSVQTDFWRKPWVNTLAYWNFDDRSASQITDATWNWRNLTWTIPTYAQLSWTDYYWIFSWSNWWKLTNWWVYDNFTLVLYMRITNTSWHQYIFDIQSSTRQFAIIRWYSSWLLELYNETTRFTIKSSTPTDTRMMIWITKSWSTIKAYYNWQYANQSTSWVISSTINFTSLWMSNWWDYFKWYLNNVILEQWIRSDSDFANYRNKTKWKYWLT